MNNLNSIILEGNVVRAPECSEPADGFRICKFSIAVNRYNKNPKGEATEEVSFVDVEAYGKLSESCEKHASKGRGIRVVGRIKQNRWKDSDGKAKSKLFVVAEHVEYKPKQLRTDENAEADSEIQGTNADTSADVQNVKQTVKETVVF